MWGTGLGDRVTYIHFAAIGSSTDTKGRMSDKDEETSLSLASEMNKWTVGFERPIIVSIVIIAKRKKVLRICQKKGPIRIRTGVVRIKTESDNHYTIGPVLVRSEV